MFSNLPAHEQLISCPYNKAHQVVAHRMPNHLMKCRRSHGTHGTKQCRFNSSHVVAIEEIKYHEENCPERLLIELMQSNNQPCNQPRESMSKDSGMGATISSFASVSQQDENWDDLEPVPTYDPKKNSETKNILRQVQHGLPFQRKEQREKEFERLQIIRGFNKE